jgi:hypothetical protein
VDMFAKQGKVASAKIVQDGTADSAIAFVRYPNKTKL